jgi:undecaprenyl-diphosphatase
VPRPPEPRLLETAALGLIHGPAELLPVSSSAHVELLPWLLGWEHARLPGSRRKEVAVALHAGTAAALLARTRRLRMPFLVAATAPPALAGLLLEGAVERRLGGPGATAAGLLAGSVALVLTDRAPQERLAVEAGAGDGLALGLGEAAALAPGVSRSAATRSAARARGFTRSAAAQLSTEVALPVLVGAASLKGVRLAQRRPPARTLAALAAGAVASAVSTAAVLRLERRAALPPAAWAAYRTGLAAAVLLVRHNRSG